MSPCCLPFPCLWPKFGILDIVLLWGAEQQPVILQPVNNHGLISLKPLFCLTMKALCYFIVFAQVLGFEDFAFRPRSFRPSSQVSVSAVMQFREHQPQNNMNEVMTALASLTALSLHGNSDGEAEPVRRPFELRS